MKGLACSKGMLQQIHRLQPLVGVWSLADVQRPSHGPWRVMLLYEGELTEAVMEQARQGRVHSIDTNSLVVPEKRVVPELLGAGCLLQMLDMRGVPLDGTWAAIFGKAAVCSAMLRELLLGGCSLRGPLPELSLPALQKLELGGNNQLTGGLEPLRGCTGLKVLDLHGRQ